MCFCQFVLIIQPKAMNTNTSTHITVVVRSHVGILGILFKSYVILFPIFNGFPIKQNSVLNVPKAN